MSPLELKKGYQMKSTLILDLWRALDDPSFEAVYLFSLLGLTLTLAFPRLVIG